MEGARPAASRWAVLAAYFVLAASTQLLWLTFAPITTQAAAVLHVDVGTAGDLALVFPFIYVVLALPTGGWLDARFGQALASGALLTAAGALVRLADTSAFGWQMAGQLLIACGQPLVLNSITKIATLHFPDAERAAAISVGTVALFIGILAAVLAGNPLFAAGGLRTVLWVEAVPGVAGAAVMLAALRVPATYHGEARASINLRWLARDRFLWVLASLVFIGMGTYNAIATWLEPILDHFREGATAGNLVAVMTAAGIVGAAFLPSLVAARDRRRDLLMAALTLSVVAFIALTVQHGNVWNGVWLFADGLLLMASLPVVLDWAALHFGAERQGEAVGFLMMAGNLGGVVLVVLVQIVIGSSVFPLLLLAAAALVGVPLALRLPTRAAQAAAGAATAVPAP